MSWGTLRSTVIRSLTGPGTARDMRPPGQSGIVTYISTSLGWRIMSDAFIELLSRVGGAALVRATTGLALCLALAAVSRDGTGGVLPAVAVIYSMLGTFMLSRGLRAEKHKSPSEAASLYVLALVHYFVSYASAVALAFVAQGG
jgi:hypothetical protein